MSDSAIFRKYLAIGHNAIRERFAELGQPPSRVSIDDVYTLLKTAPDGNLPLCGITIPESAHRMIQDHFLKCCIRAGCSDSYLLDKLAAPLTLPLNIKTKELA